MGFFIHREREHDRVITMGQASRAINPEPPKDLAVREFATAEEFLDAPPEPVKNQRGRPKKMADEKKLGHETGVKKISQEPADKQGPVGTGAQEQPRREPGEEVKIGGDKESEGGKEE